MYQLSSGLSRFRKWLNIAVSNEPTDALIDGRMTFSFCDYVIKASFNVNSIHSPSIMSPTQRSIAEVHANITCISIKLNHPNQNMPQLDIDKFMISTQDLLHTRIGANI